jgi:hypothetical protein
MEAESGKLYRRKRAGEAVRSTGSREVGKSVESVLKMFNIQKTLGGKGMIAIIRR